MRFTCTRDRLVAALQIVGNVVSGRAMKPVYESVLIRSRENGLELQATDLEVAIRFTLTDEKLRLDTPGALVVPAARLSSILREIDDEVVDFSWEQEKLSVEGKRAHFLIMGLPEAEFPEIPDFPAEGGVVLPARLFRRMVDRSAFAAAKEKMRYALNGVLLSLEEGRLQMVGTDGRRLAHNLGRVENPSGAKLRVIVPTKGVQQMAKVLGEEEEKMELALLDNQLVARSANAVVISRLVEGSFPNYEEVIPVNCERKVRVRTEDFKSAIRKAALLTVREAQSVRFSFGEGRLTLSARAADVGEANVETDIEYEGAPADVAFNPVYLLDGLSVMDAEYVRFEFRNPTSPAKLTDGEDFTYVVMPISLD